MNFKGRAIDIASRTALQAGALVLLGLFFGYMNCGQGPSRTDDTVTGNPLVEFNVEDYSAPLTEFQVCLTAVELVPVAGGAPVTIEFEDYDATLSGEGTLLEKTEIPAGTYGRINLVLANTCGSGYSTMITNSNGTFKSQSTLKMPFDGTFIAQAPDKRISLDINAIASSLNSVNSDAAVTGAAQTAGGSYTVETPALMVVLDDFSYMRKNRVFSNLWIPQTYSSQTVDTNAGNLRDVATGAGGVAFAFFPYASGYKFPTGYAQFYGKSGKWNPDFNRLRFTMTCDGNISRRSDGGSILDINAFVRKHDETADTYAGYQYTHQFNPNVYSGRELKIVLNRLPQTYSGAAVTEQPSLDPEFARSGVHHFDGLTRFEIVSASGGGWNGRTCVFDDMIFERVDGDPDSLIGGLTATYTGTAYEATWATPKNQTVTYEIRVSVQSMKATGFSSGTAAGSVTNNGNQFCNVVWTGSPTAAAAKLFIAIRPVGSAEFTEVSVP